MCGACGSGRTRGPWEDAVEPAGPAARRRRAAALSRLLTAWRWRVEPWGAGYSVRGPVGVLPPAGGVDDVVARAGLARPELLGSLAAAHREQPADGGEAAVQASLLAWAGAAVWLRGPSIEHARRVSAHGRIVELVPDRDAWRTDVPGYGVWSTGTAVAQ